MSIITMLSGQVGQVLWSVMMYGILHEYKLETVKKVVIERTMK
jgi:hypothetical protein